MPEPTPHHRLAVRRSVGGLALAVDITLSAPWTLIFGPSGSGKSTLLRAASGLPDSRGITFARHQPPGYWQVLLGVRTHASPTELALAYAPQQASLFPNLTVEQNLAFAAQARGRAKEFKPQITALLDLFELTPLRNRRPAALSGGERQRVNLARAFAVPEARLLLLDEPFTGIDRALRDRLLPRMRSWLAERNLPVLSVSHDLDEALLLDAEIIRIEAGRLVRQGPAARVLAAERDRLLQLLTASATP